jgi:hypothetical protein
MNKIADYFYKSWRGAVLILCLAAVAFVLYFHRLGELLPGYANIEVSSLRNASDWHKIVTDPLNAPYKVCVWLLTAVHHSSILATRLVAASFATLSGLIFFAILRMRSHFYMALLGTVLFVTSAGLMHYGRLGSAQILQTAVLALMAAILYYRKLTSHRVLASYGLILLLTVLWYIPGIVWFELFGVVLLNQGIRRRLSTAAIKHKIGWALISLAVLAPLVLACAKHPALIGTTLGLPHNLHALTHVATNLWHVLLGIGTHSTGDPLYNVGHVPLLNTVELALGAIGLYVHVRHERSDRSVFLIGSIVLSILLISLGGAVGYAALIPLLYLLIGRGVNHLLGRWFTVFPRNPIAKAAGIVFVCGMLFFSVLYQVRSYFVAWPHTDSTKQVFTNKPNNS